MTRVEVVWTRFVPDELILSFTRSSDVTERVQSCIDEVMTSSPPTSVRSFKNANDVSHDVMSVILIALPHEPETDGDES